MSGFRETIKGGLRKDGKVAGWLGRGNDHTSVDAAYQHVSRPLSTLVDPSSFEPPPKNINYHGGTAQNKTKSIKSGLGAPLTQAEIQAEQKKKEEREREAEKERQATAPPIPFRIDTTGLSTSNLPPPPKRVGGEDGEDGEDGADGRSPAIAPRSKPGLPPRLPPRQQSNPDQSSISTPPKYSAAAAEAPSHKGILNQSSLNRLGAAGVSVPSLGIGGKQTPKPPARTPGMKTGPETTSSLPVTSLNSNGGPNLNELQSRFSRLSASASSGAPAQGTTLAQKQAALRTASAFRKDPSSVSLADARNAASTANNFRERHGDQVSAGWKSANSLNQKYGLSDKLGKNTNSGSNTSEAPPGASEGPDIEARDNTIATKKPPPPTPKKKRELAGLSIASASPPPIPLATKPRPNIASLNTAQNDMDLDLKSLWFAKQPVVFPPPSISRLPGSWTPAYTMGWSSDGVRKTYYLTGAIRDDITLITTKFHLTWDGNEPGLTVKAEQMHLPPPRPLSRRELEDYRDRYGERIAAWCEARIGQKVGDGECWTLANDALKSVAEDCRARKEEPCVPSRSYVHGVLIYSCLPPKTADPPGGIEAAGVSRGDIIQFLNAHMRSKDGMSNSQRGVPHHSAVITAVERGGILKVLEQNVGRTKKVMQGTIDLSEMFSGEVRIFRPIGTNWLVPLDLSWP